VLLKIACLIRRWFRLAVLMSRGDQEKTAELPVLRHENAVLRRNVGRARYDAADRAWPGAAQDHLLAHALDFRPGCPDVPRDQARKAELLVLRHENAVLPERWPGALRAG
jgi:hypothetical protein